MRTLLVLLIFLLIGCHSTHPQETERIEPALLFADQLAADGCQASIQLSSDSLLYAATSSSQPVVDKALSNIPPDKKLYEMNGYSRTILIRYTKTGRRISQACGWGATRQVGELNVIDITKY